MADQGEQVPQVPAGENLQADQAVAVMPPPPQNQEEPANPNPGQSAAGEQVTQGSTLRLTGRQCDQKSSVGD